VKATLAPAGAIPVSLAVARSLADFPSAISSVGGSSASEPMPNFDVTTRATVPQVTLFPPSDTCTSRK
jgi:hypothetical protein